MLARGSRLGDYEILDSEVLGLGRSAVTYRALHVDQGIEVALKVPHAKLAADSTFYFRFLREAALGSRLDHRSIARVVDSGEIEDKLFIAMEFVDGRSVDVELARSGPMALERALKVVREVADALAHAHAHGVVHRNLKPGHLMVVPADGVKVLDFGVARDFGQVGLTSSGVFLGTPQYSAPEAADPRRLDQHSDLYSLGIILFELLQGHPPFEAASPVEIMIKHCTESLPGADAIEVPVPRAVWDLVERLCRKQPAERPRAATQVVKEIDRLLEHLARRGEARPAPSGGRTGQAPASV